MLGRILGLVLLLAGGALLRGEPTLVAATAPGIQAHRPDFERPAAAPGLSRPRVQRGTALRSERPLAAQVLVRVPVLGPTAPAPEAGPRATAPAPRATGRAERAPPLLQR